MKLGLAIAGLTGAALAAGAQAQPLARPLADVPVHSYRMALGNDSASRWAQMTSVPMLLKGEQRWIAQRVQSRRLGFGNEHLTASVYFVRSKRAPYRSMSRLVLGERLSRKAIGGDVRFQPGEGAAFRFRAAALDTNARPSVGALGTKALKDRRMLVGAGIELPGLGVAMFDYVRLKAGGGQIAGLASRDNERSGSGPRLTLSGTADSARLGWTLTMASMRRPDVGQLDTRAQVGFRFGF